MLGNIKNIKNAHTEILKRDHVNHNDITQK